MSKFQILLCTIVFLTAATAFQPSSGQQSPRINLPYQPSGTTISTANLKANFDELEKVLNNLAADIDDLRRNVIPVGVIAHFNLTECPTSWRELQVARGRYLVGRQVEGSLGEPIGIPLIVNENREVGKHTHSTAQAGLHEHQLAEAGRHQHAYADSAMGGTRGAMQPGNSWARQDVPRTTEQAGLHSHEMLGSGNHIHIIEATGTTTGTNAPYVPYTVCEKL